MKNKTAYLISCSDHYDHRLFVMDGYLRSKGYQTTYITSDFDHTTKTQFVSSIPNSVQLHALPYRKNLSVARMLSHRSFAQKVFCYLESLSDEPGVIVALLPPNFLGHYAARYKKKHPKVTLIYDVFDLWPETFPSDRAKKLLNPVFKIWSWLRDHSLGSADFVFTECDLFQEKLRLPSDRFRTIYPCAEPVDLAQVPVSLKDDGIELCYLGSINNIISIPDICVLIRELSKSRPVTLHIVGKGEREQELIAKSQEAGAKVIFHGAVYDEKEKLRLLSACHFGLNIMKESVCVGLTMKSVDYFRYGLPIINNIPGDTAKIVEKYGVGIPYDEKCIFNVLSLSLDDCLDMRRRVAGFFSEKLTKDHILSEISDSIGEIV